MLLIQSQLSECLKVDVPIKAIWNFLHAHWNMKGAVSLIKDSNI